MNTQWKLVPVEPTREMLVAALKTNGACPTYAAMLSASPTPPAAVAPPVAWLDPDSIQHGEILSAQAKKNSEFLGQQARARRFSVPLYAHPDAGEIARLTAERDALQQRLNAADQKVDELISAVRSINHAKHHEVLLRGDDEPQYPQRKEWVDWILGLCDEPASHPEIMMDDDWHMNPCKQGHRDVGASGGVAACNQCDEKIEAATTQEAFQRWNASHPEPQA